MTDLEGPELAPVGNPAAEPSLWMKFVMSRRKASANSVRGTRPSEIRSRKSIADQLVSFRATALAVIDGMEKPSAKHWEQARGEIDREAATLTEEFDEATYPAREA
jgi:hypothetical protein